MTDPSHHARALLQALESTAFPDPAQKAAASWMTHGLRAQMMGLRLDRALGLTQPGRVTEQTRLRRARRNMLIAEAFMLADQDTATLLDAIKRLKRKSWRDEPLAPPNVGALLSVLHQARQLGPIPGRRQIERIVATLIRRFS